MKKIIMLCAFFAVIWPTMAQAQSADKKILFMSPDDIVQMLEKTKGKKRVLVLLGTDCVECHAKFLDILHLDQGKRHVIIPIFHSEKMLDFKRYIRSFNEIPIKVVYNSGSQYALMQSLRPYGVRPWKTLPRVILLDANNRVFGQGNHSADKISIFLSRNMNN